MIKFSKEKVLLLHQLIAEETGGSIGVRDEALLESALENAFSSFDGQEFYPSKEEKGARLGYTLISNHAFVDGNKRIGMYVMLTFLEVNGIRLECTNEEIVRTSRMSVFLFSIAGSSIAFTLSFSSCLTISIFSLKLSADALRHKVISATLIFFILAFLLINLLYMPYFKGYVQPKLSSILPH